MTAAAPPACAPTSGSAAIGSRPSAISRRRRQPSTVDAKGLAVAPGFINMLSWANESLIVDGRSLGEIRQGVTTEIFGEGTSMGPLTDEMKTRWKSEQGDIKFEYSLDDARRISEVFWKRRAWRRTSRRSSAPARFASTSSDSTNRRPTPAELDRMRALVRQEMEAGALGIGSSLIYAPDNFASTEELIELCKVAAAHGGHYISHMRSEGNRLVEAVEELIRISREAKIPAEIYHLKAAGQANWGKMDRVLALVEEARASGLRDHRGHVPVSGGIDGPQCRDSAVGARGRIPGAVQASARSRRAGEDPQGDGDAHRRVGEPLPRGRISRSRAARRLQEREAQAAHRQDARGGREDAQQGSVRHHPRSDARG